MEIDTEALSLTDIIRLQTRLSETLQRRFERSLALVFTDIADSTAYFARFGDQMGRQMQQRHLDLLLACVTADGGRIVDCAGDGAFSCFSSVEGATSAIVALARGVTAQNETFSREHQLVLRTGVHWGPVLTDGTVVTGDAVNLAARVASTCAPGEVRLTDAAFRELSKERRLRCRALPRVQMKGITEPVGMVALDLRERATHPAFVRIAESGQTFALPAKDTIAFGRLGDHGGVPGNDVVLSLPDRGHAQVVSRWHFELRRGPEGYVLRSLTTQSTVVDGRALASGEEAPIRVGSTATVGGVITLEFRAEPAAAGGLSEETLAR